MKWRACRLGDVLTLKRGHDLPSDSRRDGEVPVVSSSGITGYHSEAKAEAPGVVTGRYGTLGEVFYLERDYWPLNTALYVVDFKGTHPKFAAYFLKNVLRDYQSDKAAVPGVDRNVLHELKVRCPERESQEAIASILSAYDELIENNRRRMVLLEESARLLHREWFALLRFPGHENSSVAGEVPLGWTRAVFGDLCDEVRVTALPEEVEPDTPYVGLEHIPRRSISITEWGKASEVTSAKHRFKTGDVLFGKIRPYFHKVAIAFTDGLASSDAIVIRSRSNSLRSFILTTASSDEFVAEAAQTMREGSKMPRADWALMMQYPVLIPPEGLMMTFSETVEIITDQLRVLCFQSQKLKVARDILLPRLMSGEVVV